MLDKVWYWSGRALFDFCSRLMLQMDVVRLAPLPDGPKIIAANHPSTVDPMLITLLTGEQMHIVIDGALFEAPVLGGYLRRSGHVPVINGNGRSTVERARELLQAGKTVTIFPEGHVSPTEGGFYPPRTGTARLALSTGAPVIPVGIHIPRERIQVLNLKLGSKGAVVKWYSRGPYVVTVGSPMYLDGDVEDRSHVRVLSEQIMGRIIQLSHAGAHRLGASPAFAPRPAL